MESDPADQVGKLKQAVSDLRDQLLSLDNTSIHREEAKLNPTIKVQ